LRAELEETAGQNAVRTQVRCGRAIAREGEPVLPGELARESNRVVLRHEVEVHLPIEVGRVEQRILCCVVVHPGLKLGCASKKMGGIEPEPILEDWSSESATHVVDVVECVRAHQA